MDGLLARVRHRATQTAFLLIIVVTCLLLVTQLTVVHRASPQRRGVIPQTHNETETGNGNSPSTTTAVPSTPPPTRHVIGRMRMSGGRLGNEMFVYAAVLGIAAKNGMLPVYRSPTLRATFDIKADMTSPGEVGVGSASLLESSAFRYDTRFGQLSTSTASGDVTVVGFFQSWKYFRDIDARVRAEFRFLPDIASVASAFMHHIALDHRLYGEPDVLYIGVHIRRTDMLADFNIKKGYTVANDEYLRSAVEYMSARYADKLLVYVVCSDDVGWSREHFGQAVKEVDAARPNRTLGAAALSGESVYRWIKDKASSAIAQFNRQPPPTSGTPGNDTDFTQSIVVYSEGHSGTQDLAILASCNHSIITVGTYGWWAGYLAGGTTVYYHYYPSKGSELERFFSREDFFPPEWISL